MLSKRYESIEVDRTTWLHVPSGTHWSTSSDTHHVVEIQKETSSKILTIRDHIGCLSAYFSVCKKNQNIYVSSMQHTQ